VVEVLAELAAMIDAVRARLGQDPFPLHQQFCASRGPAAENAPGESKQAKAWLAELGEA
jgi:hypothetical protein